MGKVSHRVLELLGRALEEEQDIYLGESNIEHMKKRHPADYAQYGQYIPQILAEPDYVGQNPTDDSIEYVKEFVVNGEYVKVAVRVSAGGMFYARSVYRLGKNRVRNFIQKGTLKRYK